jgi:DNA-3-methyladenine glycosylase
VRLLRPFFRTDPIALARNLLGQRLVRVLNGQRLAGLIVETEAYLGIPDRAAHTYNGRRTPRNASMWCDGGTAYVYFTYGMHFCLNVVAGQVDNPVAVLIRALEPIEGLADMRLRRAKARRDHDLCSGPAKLCQALAIDRALDGMDLTASNVLFIERARRKPLTPGEITRGPRIGVAYAGPWAAKPLRFCLRGNEHVSKK